MIIRAFLHENPLEKTFGLAGKPSLTDTTRPQAFSPASRNGAFGLERNPCSLLAVLALVADPAATVAGSVAIRETPTARQTPS